jgi:hypothetical protein
MARMNWTSDRDRRLVRDSIDRSGGVHWWLLACPFCRSRITVHATLNQIVKAYMIGCPRCKKAAAGASWRRQLWHYVPSGPKKKRKASRRPRRPTGQE